MDVESGKPAQVELVSKKAIPWHKVSLGLTVCLVVSLAYLHFGAKDVAKALPTFQPVIQRPTHPTFVNGQHRVRRGKGRQAGRVRRGSCCPSGSSDEYWLSHTCSSFLLSKWPGCSGLWMAWKRLRCT